MYKRRENKQIIMNFFQKESVDDEVRNQQNLGLDRIRE